MDDPARFSVRPVEEGTQARIVVTGELDLATVPYLEASIREQRAAQRDVLLDLAGLEFLDSSGIRALLVAVNDSTANGWALSIAPELTNTVRKTLQISGLLERLPFAEM